MHAQSISIIDAPLQNLPAAKSDPTAGAVVSFEGIVRPNEDNRPISGLRYTTYDPMAHNTLAALANQAAEQFGLTSIAVGHSRGFIAVGQCSFRLTIAAPHRREALDAMDWFIDRMKLDAPIWKTPEFANDLPATQRQAAE